MVLLETIEEAAEKEEVRGMIERHAELNDSGVAKLILDGWEQTSARFVRVIPKDYKRMLEQIEKAESTGLTGEAALLAAFEANMRELARTGG